LPLLNLWRFWVMLVLPCLKLATMVLPPLRRAGAACMGGRRGSGEAAFSAANTPTRCRAGTAPACIAGTEARARGGGA
jgi:hypothetical protein